MEVHTPRQDKRSVPLTRIEPQTGTVSPVIQRITDVGSYYRHGEFELGPFTVEDENELAFDQQLAGRLGVEGKEIFIAREREKHRPTIFDEVSDVLGSTIRRDMAAKLILFSAGLLTFTDEDQINVLMAGESSGGKSYNPLEVAAYFPSDIVRIIATASPTAFFHDAGTWDKEERLLRVDLKGQLLIFLDQPHYMLMERLRPLLSHDRRELLYKITDKSARGALRTKNVILEGYCTVIFCAAKLSLDDQERTRVFILSPETNPEKLDESLRLTLARVGDRDTFRQWVDQHPRRRWLRTRIEAVRHAKILEVIIDDQEAVYARFKGSHPRLAPRHQRDLPRIISLIKAHALLNCWHREKPREGVIVATAADVEAGFSLYSLVAKPNELGLSPQVYEIYETVIQPLFRSHVATGVDRKTVLAEYHQAYGRPLTEAKLRQDILPALESAGLVVEQPDPTDKRRMLVYPPDVLTISPVARNSELITGTPHDQRALALGE